ncbi:unnamed protein product [Notodromas monacha]|uniref:Uncharacterized protein n=1 Tax=Notodromas monacha TaxID=399045 RepID=A0A7R9GIT2_9CRUS|nr:unnamed protein product [Notodromas monacha]CAG0924147.1 unnamed protein product [Notodromas monacha]
MTATHHHSGLGLKAGSVSPLERVRRALGGGHSRDSSSDSSDGQQHHSHSLSRSPKFCGGGSVGGGGGRGLPHSSFSCPADLLSHGHGAGRAQGSGPLFGRCLSSYSPVGSVPPVLKMLCDFLEANGRMPTDDPNLSGNPLGSFSGFRDGCCL